MSGAPVIDEVVVEFLVESNENLDRLDQDLLAFEQDPGSKTTLASIFRTIHTIKGTCGFLGFSRLEAVTHSGENLLSKLRDGEIQPRAEMFTVLLSLVDAVRAILTAIETTGNEPDVDNAALVGHLDRRSTAAGPPVEAPMAITSMPIGAILEGGGSSTPASWWLTCAVAATTSFARSSVNIASAGVPGAGFCTSSMAPAESASSARLAPRVDGALTSTVGVGLCVSSRRRSSRPVRPGKSASSVSTSGARSAMRSRTSSALRSAART
jgi:two-component system chemotaxis sensor kinase CheA